GEELVDVAALEEADAELLPDAHRLLGAAAAENRAGAAEARDLGMQRLDLPGAAAGDHLGTPDDLDEVEPELLAVDDGRGEVGDAVEADAVAALLDEVAGEEIGAGIGEDVDHLQLEDDGAARRRAESGIEGEEALGEQRR